MKTKIISDSEVYNKQKDLAIELIEKFKGIVVLNVTHYIDDRKKRNKEFFIDSFKLVLSQQITLYLSHDADNNIFAEFDYSQMFDNDKAYGVFTKIKLFLQKHYIKISN